MTKERTPAFLFYPRQFSGDEHVQAMDLDSVGAHIILMASAAASPERYRIHADEHAIRNRLRNPSDGDWQRIKRQLLAGAWKVSADGMWWEQHGLRRTFEKQTKFSDEQRDRATKRWQRGNTENVPDGCRNDAEQNAGSMLAVAVSVSKENSQSADAQHVASQVAREHGITDKQAIIAIAEQIASELNAGGRDKFILADEVSAAIKTYQATEEFKGQYRKSWRNFFGDRDTWRKFVTKAATRKVITPSQAQEMALARCQ